MPGTRDELEAIARTKTAVPERTAAALLGLAVLDMVAEEAAWDGPDPEATAARARAGAVTGLRRLLADFPSYLRRDDALYLLGICLEQERDDRGALAAYRQLLGDHPTSHHVPEVWFRVGEIHFAAGDLANAALAYERAQAQPDGRLATVALYKLGWTHYRADRYAEAIDAFDRLLTRAGPSAEHDALRPEAVQYLALSLIEPDWDGDGAPGPVRAGGRVATPPA